MLTDEEEPENEEAKDVGIKTKTFEIGDASQNDEYM